VAARWWWPPTWRNLDLERIVSRVVDSLGGLDVLVNNASFYPGKEIYSVDLAQWQYVMNVNLRAPWYLSNWCIPTCGRAVAAIVNVSSTSGLHHDIGLGVYGISRRRRGTYARDVRRVGDTRYRSTALHRA
jgi:NAD(P)-dependent dehydrogenase (short-subunit alcohol dehydrogenase family)